ncbi:MAG: ATP-binding cassette domain-containing protein [Saprospiraceae bacterium]|nr:ATP-binding cassette domain-containing protein [Saprospiraceae bacterium]
MDILTIENVRKAYHSHVALDSVSFSVKKGTIFGLLGPNGAGKTTLIRIITNITKADQGAVYLDNELLSIHHPRDIGYMPEERGLYKKMKVADQLMYLAQLKGLSHDEAKASIKMWFDRLQMAGWWNKKIEELSKGMQQKVQFVATVAHKPKLLILDEPFTGLDPVNADLLKDEIYQLHKEGVSIVFSTHRMEQVEEICDDIVLINKGNILLNDSVSSVRTQFKENIFTLTTDVPAQNWDLIPGFESVEEQGFSRTFKVGEGHHSNQLLGYLLDKGIKIQSFHEVLPGLNEIFIKLVKTESNHAHE